jgi:hypothetical protein
MRVTLHIDSCTDAEMRRAVLAWHVTDTSGRYKKPVLALDGLVVKVMGSSWNIDSPPIEPERAEQIVRAARCAQQLEWLKEWRDESLAHDPRIKEGGEYDKHGKHLGGIITEPTTWDDDAEWQEYLAGGTKQLREV